jgi:hypothetical protein
MYYGMQLFTEAAPAGSRLLQLQLDHGAALRAWATRAVNGTVHVVVINDSLTTARPALVAVAGWQGGATLTRLRAPSVNSTSGVTLGGRSYGSSTSTGLLAGASRSVMLIPGPRGYSFTLPPASAAMLTIR